MSIYAVRRRVACYVTRERSDGLELLVLDHTNDDPEVPSGTQVPAGGMTQFESIEDAAFREIEEETGLIGLKFVGQLGGQETGLHDKRGPSMTTFVHVTAPADGSDAWEHTVHGDTNDEDLGMVFKCRWERLPLDIELAGGQGEFLDRLPKRPESLRERIVDKLRDKLDDRLNKDADT